MITMKNILITIVLICITGFVLQKNGVFPSLCTKPTISTLNKTTVVSKINELKKADADGFAIVELFTSEGCSSCPAADALLGNLAGEKKKNVYVLSYHVDYWNRLGWKDPFSKPEWTARQAAYVNQFNLESAYTPQAVVNGKHEFIGSSNAQLYNLVEKALNEEAFTRLHISAELKAGKINISYELPPENNVTINLALVEEKTSTNVRRGENGSRHLVHTNVVRELVTRNRSDINSLSLTIPANFNPANFKVIAFIQNIVDLKIISAAEAEIQ